MRPSRRTLLLGGVAGLGAGLAGVLEGVLPGGPSLRRTLGLVGPDGVVPDIAAPPTLVRRFASRARHTAVDVVAVIPAGADPATVPVCVALHGRGSSARNLVGYGLPRFLAAAIDSGVPPFAIVAVDGGDSYWVARNGDDPQAMLRDELPGWLAAMGLGRPVTAAVGISMGGFGALRHARDGTTGAVAVLSPALFDTWAVAAGRNAFADESSWAANEPLRHVDTLPASVHVGVWCGLEDPFIDTATEFATRARAEPHFDHGEHTPGYWQRVLPEALAFLGSRI